VVKKEQGASTKLSGTHRYVLTDKGSTTITAVLTARQANINHVSTGVKTARSQSSCGRLQSHVWSTAGEGF
jgi:hypothetical protein